FHHAAWRLHRLILSVGDELFNCLISWFPLAYLPATVIFSLQTNQPHVGLVVRGPVGLVQKLVYVRCLDTVALLQLPHALHLLYETMDLLVFTVLAAEGIIELCHPYRSVIFCERLQGPFHILAIGVPNGDIPLDSVLMHALESAEMPPTCRTDGFPNCRINGHRSV